MSELIFRLNPDSWDAELLVDGNVAASSGADVFESWAVAWAEAHGYVLESSVEEDVDQDVDTEESDAVESDATEDDDTAGEEEFLDSDDGIVEIPDQDV